MGLTCIVLKMMLRRVKFRSYTAVTSRRWTQSLARYSTSAAATETTSSSSKEHAKIDPSEFADFETEPAKFDFDAVELPSEEQLEKNLQPMPIQIPGKLGERLKLLFDLATGWDVVDKVNEDLIALEEAIKSSPDLFRTFRSVDTSESLRNKVCNSLYDAGAHIVTIRWFYWLIEQGKLDTTLQLIDGWKRIVRAYRNEVPIELVFAQQPTEKQIKKYKSRVTHKYLKPSDKPNWEIKVDPAIKGGWIARVGAEENCQTYDFSEKTEEELVQDKIEDAVSQATFRAYFPPVVEDLHQDILGIGDKLNQKEKSTV